MNTLKDKAAYYELGLFLGIINTDEIIKWCDSEILKSETPNHDLFELTLLKNSKDILAKLKRLSEGANKPDALRKVLGLLYKILDKDNAMSFSNELYKLILDLEINFDDTPDLYDIHRIDDNFYLERDGVIEIDSYNELKMFLKQFSKEA